MQTLFPAVPDCKTEFVLLSSAEDSEEVVLLSACLEKKIIIIKYIYMYLKEMADKKQHNKDEQDAGQK